MQNPPLTPGVEQNARHLTPGVYEQHVDGQLKELALHTLGEDCAIPMIFLAGYGCISDPYRSIDVRIMGHHEPTLEQQ